MYSTRNVFGERAVLFVEHSGLLPRPILLPGPGITVSERARRATGPVAELDHIVPARPDRITGLPTLGTTSANNLPTPCQHHHLSKDAGRGFTARRNASTGTYRWTTPLGRVYSWTPEPRWTPDFDEFSDEWAIVAGDWADGFATRAG